MKLIEVMNKAKANKVPAPKMRLGEYKFSQSPNKPFIWVTDLGKYGENEYYGKIDSTTGVLYPVNGLINIHMENIKQIIEDVGPAAKAYGQKHGTCCICGRDLINKTSVKYMIGPICAEKFGFNLFDMVEEEIMLSKQEQLDLALGEL